MTHELALDLVLGGGGAGRVLARSRISRGANAMCTRTVD